MSYPCGELDFLLGDPGSQDGRLAAKLFLLRGKPSGLLGHQFSLNQSLVRRSINSPAIWPDVLKGLWSPRKLLQAEVCRCWPLASWLYNGKPGGIRKKHHFTPALTVPSENPLWQRNRREHLIFLIFASLFSPSVSGCTSLSRDIIWGAYHKSCISKGYWEENLKWRAHLQTRKSPWLGWWYHGSHLPVQIALTVRCPPESQVRTELQVSSDARPWPPGGWHTFFFSQKYIPLIKCVPREKRGESWFA